MTTDNKQLEDRKKQIAEMFLESLSTMRPKLPDEVKKRRGITEAKFAEEDPNLRSGGGDYEDITNVLQTRLLKTYDRWAIDTRKQLLDAQDMGISPNQFGSIIAGRTSILESDLIAVSNEGVNSAVRRTLPLKRRNSPRVRKVTGDLNRSISGGIKTSLIDSIQTRLTKKFVDVEQFDRSSLKDVFDSARASVASMAGSAWQGIFLALMAAGQDQEEETGKTQRVRWVLNDLADHCADSPGRFGCPGQSGIYNSWAELETVPAANVTCRGNCRCRLEVETSPGSNVWERGLPGFTP